MRILAGLTVVLVAGLLLVGPGAAQSETVETDNGTLVVVSPSVTTDDPTTDRNATMEVSIVNAEGSEDTLRISEIEVFDTDDGSDDPIGETDEHPNVPPGITADRDVSVDFEETGFREILVHVDMETVDGGGNLTVVRTTTVHVGEAHPDLSISAGSVGPAGRTSFNVSVANNFDGTIRSMAVEIGDDAPTVHENRKLTSGIGSGETATFTFDVTNVSTRRYEVPLTLTYTTANGTQRRTTETLPIRLSAATNPANVTLTGLDPVRSSDTITIRGSAANRGSNPADSVEVRVTSGDSVGPAPSRSSYFVGTVPASDVSSFEVNAETRTNETVTIPLEVSFISDGIEVTRQRTVTYEPPTEDVKGETSGGGLPVLPILGVVVVVLLGLAVRRYRGG